MAMPKKIKVLLTPESITDAIQYLQNYGNELNRKAAELAEKLANIGYNVSFGILADHVYSGETISSLSVIQTSPTRFEVVAGSVALLFLEFGAGINGVGHELAGQFGMGAGTYPGQTHAFDPQGWWFPTDDPNLAVYTSKKTGQMYGHSYGNPPYKPMYQASVEIRHNIEKAAKEVFRK